MPILLRIDMANEAAYFLAGGIMQYVLEQLVAPRQETTNAKSFAPLRD